MPENLKEGICTITSLVDETGNIGVNMTRLASQPAVANAPVTQWEVKNVEGKKDVYLLSVSGYSSTFIDGDIVTVSNLEDEPQEWYVTYQVAQDAYLIMAQDDGTGWCAMMGEEDGTSIKLAPIISTRTIPPQFLPTQLFTFEFSD